MLINTFERDARHEGWKDGVQAGLAQGAYQKSLETARLMKLRNFDNNLIMEMTGLSKSEVEKL